MHVCDGERHPPQACPPDSYATLVEARDAIRDARRERAGGEDDESNHILLAEVFIAAGVHRLAAPLELDARDSHVVWRAADPDGGVALLSGAVPLPSEQWKPAVTRCRLTSG